MYHYTQKSILSKVWFIYVLLILKIACKKNIRGKIILTVSTV